jgi:hypothetical protein
MTVCKYYKGCEPFTACSLIKKSAKSAYCPWIERKSMQETITGIVIRVGEMKVDDETLTGIFVEIPQDTIETSNMNILFKKVKITTPKKLQGE